MKKNENVELGVHLCHKRIKEYLVTRMEEVKKHYPSSLSDFLGTVTSDIDDVVDNLLESWGEE